MLAGIAIVQFIFDLSMTHSFGTFLAQYFLPMLFGLDDTGSCGPFGREPDGS